MSSCELTPLSKDAGSGLQSMTFPAYRSLLDLKQRPRHESHGDTRVVQPFGFVALRDHQPVGLALAELPVEEGDMQAPQLLSIFVDSEARRKGVGAALVRSIEEETLRRGFGELAGLYTTGRPAIDWMERIFEHRGWLEPEPFSMSVRFSPTTALTSPAFEERRIELMSRGLEIFPWSELSQEEEDEMRTSNEKMCWIEPALEPWQLDRADLHWSSVGARYNNKVVGWVLNHSVLPGVVRFTISYMRKDLSRRGRILALYHASLRSIEERGNCQFCTFLTPYSYPKMVHFIERWIQPISSFVGESRKIRVALPAKLP